MESTTIAEGESARIEALRSYAVLDSQPEDAFDAIVRLAANVCETPVALISLVDEARQWFKARVGWDTNEVPREIAFCAHAIQGRELCLVSDALTDLRFRQNPLVLGEPHIRFYAGMPLVTQDGFAVGTLCVIDHEPRGALTSDQRRCLHLLAKETMTQLELRRALKETSEGKDVIRDINLELEAFSGAVAHDLRAPLRHIDAFASMLAEHTPVDAITQRWITGIRAACGRAHATINSLLLLSRATGSELQTETVDLSALAHDVLDALRHAQPDREVDVIIQSGLSARGDAALLRLILDNLISNAWKFTSKRARARIEFGARELDTQAMEYFVRDNGVGLDPSRLTLPPRAFARQHCEEVFEGIGLGLTIVYRALRRLGGSLRAEGHPDVGASFFFTLSTPEQSGQQGAVAEG